MKKTLALVLSLVLVAAMMLPAFATEKPYIAVISKGFQHQFWQTVAAGAKDAAEKYGVDHTFDGPPSESDIQIQVDMLNAAIAKKPVALALAALDTESVTEQLTKCKEDGIPVVGFDSGVPNAPEGSIVSTASTNTENAGALAAEKMFEIPEIAAALAAATADAPAIIAVFSQDATSASVTGRTIGFLNKMAELCEGVAPGKVAISGHDKYAKPVDGAVIDLNVNVPATTNPADCQTTAQGILDKAGVVGVFCSNEASVGGILAATTDGQDLDRANGKYKSMICIGFDAGANQKNAVKQGWFYGSITQDPYMIGYLAVELAVKAVNGETVEPIVDTGCQFYNAANMDDAKIAQLLYD